MINTLNSVSKNSPQADSGPTALVTWMVASISFVMVAILEYAFILNFHLRTKKVHEETSKNGAWKSSDKAEKVDKVDRIMSIAFPTTFLVTAVTFWSAL